MADFAFVHYTGEPVRQQSARIPQTLWEEKKAQIIGLFENHTLSEVIKKMAADGFKASRRQYIHRLGQWGATKYSVSQDKTSNTNDVANGKRKHVSDGVVPGDDEDDTPSSKTPSSPLPSGKRPRVAVEQATDPDENAAEAPVVDHPEQTLATMGTEDTTAAGDVSEFNSGCSESFKSAADEFWAFAYSSKSDWTAGEGNYRIAVEVSRLAKMSRAQPSETPMGLNISDDMRAYLNDIGDYLWGVKRGEDAFDIYALMLETGDSHIRETDVGTLLYCAQSAHSPETCRWVLTLLRKGKTLETAPPDIWDVSILACLVLMEKFLRYGLREKAEYCKHMALDQSRGRGSSLLPGNMNKMRLCILDSIQDMYWDHAESMLAPIDWSNISRDRIWSSQWSDFSLSLKSELITTLEALMKNAQDTMDPCTAGYKNKDAEKAPLSSRIFRILWYIKSKEPQPFALEKKESLFSTQKKFGVLLPDFVGTCCDFLARIIAIYQEGGGISDLLTGREGLRIAGLILFVDQMKASDLDSEFTRSYWARNTVTRYPLEGLGGYRPPVYLLDAPGGEEVVERLAYPVSSSLPLSVQRGSMDVEDYYLDPTLGPQRGSSLASYEQMVEASAAMARSRKQAGEKKTSEGSGGNLPSAGLEMDGLSVSMGSMSLHGE